MADTDETTPPAPESADDEVAETAPARLRLRRTWPQRLVLGVNILIVLGCFTAALGVWYAHEKANDSKQVTLGPPPTSAAPATTTPVTVPGAPTTTAPSGPTTTAFTVPPLADLSAKNFLITGTDNNACIDPDSPYAPVFGDRTGLGERSDTIMIIRIDPATSRAAVLSFPRDLWVQIAGTNRKSRINSAFTRDDPSILINTIYENFGITVDHYINIDFCAFKNIVDAVGGVKVPFEYAVRDTRSMLNVPGPMCFEFDGESGLAYVRSRHFEYLDPDTGEWTQDPAADLGRVSRQQDFLQRLVQEAFDAGVRDPLVAKELMDTALEYVIRDDQLTIGRLLEFAQAMRNLDPASMQTYQITATGQMINGNAVLVPNLNGGNMQAVLAIFRGEAQLAGAPEQVFDTPTTTAAPSPSSSTGSSPSTTTVAPTSTLPVVEVEEIVRGIVPPDDPTCR